MNKRNDPRIERDALGEVEIPPGALWGLQTARSREYFAPSGLRPHPRLVDALVITKKAAAQANIEGGRLDERLGRTIAQVADEILSGQWREQFVVDPYQAESGAALNDNVNEVLANRAAEILGEAPGAYELVSPQAHVNLGQSASDVFPTAMRLSLLLSLRDFEPVVLDLERLLRRKSLEFDKIIKVGRAHLRDTAPITLGQEFNAYGSSIERSYRRIREASNNLSEVSLGATTIGTGLNADATYLQRSVERLSQASGLRLRPAEDYFRVTQSMSDFMEFSSTLKELSVELIKIANDLRLLASGPQAGLGEIKLPPVRLEPSPLLPDLMPARANPTLPECVNVVAFQVIGNDTTVMLAAQAGQLEVNVMTPIIIHNILSSLDLLKNTLAAFNQRCLSGISANNKRCADLLDASNLMAVSLVPHLGTETLASLVEESLATGKSVRELVVERELIPADALSKILQQKTLTQPGIPVGTSDDTTQ